MTTKIEEVPDRVDKAARFLRETQNAGKRLLNWSSLPRSSKKKWWKLAEGTLAAADVTDN